MANIQEWAKGITFFIFVTLMFYFLWQYIFSGVIDFMGQDIFGIGSEGSTSIAILKTAAWVSFIFLYLGTGGVYLFYSIIIGTTGTIVTEPLQLLKGIALWVILTPILSFFYGLTHILVTALNNSNILDATLQGEATTFSWIFALIILAMTIILPFIYILKGYGVDIMSRKEVKQ